MADDTEFFRTLVSAVNRAFDEISDLRKSIEWFQWARDGLTRFFFLICAQRYVGTPYDEVEAGKIRKTIGDCERAIDQKSERACFLYRSAWQWMKIAVLYDGPEDEKELLIQAIDEIEAGSKPANSGGIVAGLSSDQCLAVLIHVSTDTERKIMDRVLSLLESRGPLVTEQVLSHVPTRSETTVKTILSRLRKIHVITSGPDGYSRSSGSKDQSQD
jgi:hypothetical protein